jgi:hypothetical protein
MFGQPKHTKPIDEQARVACPAQTNMWGSASKATMRKRILRPHQSPSKSMQICLRAYLIFETNSSDSSSKTFRTGSTYMFAKNIVTNNKNVSQHHVPYMNSL